MVALALTALAAAFVAPAARPVALTAPRMAPAPTSVKMSQLATPFTYESTSSTLYEPHMYGSYGGGYGGMARYGMGGYGMSSGMGGYGRGMYGGYGGMCTSTARLDLPFTPGGNEAIFPSPYLLSDDVLANSRLQPFDARV